MSLAWRGLGHFLWRKCQRCRLDGYHCSASGLDGHPCFRDQKSRSLCRAVRFPKPHTCRTLLQVLRGQIFRTAAAFE